MQFSKRTVQAAFGAMALSMVAMTADAATVNVTANITTNTTWTKSNEYVLTQAIFVKDGATLTIEEGTVVRGVPPGAAAEPGTLIVTRGSKIVADGTPSEPIVFTDANDDNVGSGSGSGAYSQKINGVTAQWGGLIVLGNAYLATDVAGSGTPSPNASLNLQIEGIEDFGNDSRYGGGDDDDDSGSLSYVSIRYGGFVLGADNEINGLTLGAVGRGTDIHHVEIFQNKDDGVEFFGSTVDTKYMMVWAVGDDSFDWDQGFRGKGQFWLVVQGVTGSSDKSDKGAEMDGGDGDDSVPSSMPTIYNATFIGHGPTVSQANTALHFRDGTGGRYFNTVVEDFGGGVAMIEGDPTNSTYEAADNVGVPYTTDAFYTHETADLAGNTAYKLAIENSVFHNNNVNNAIGLASGSGAAGTWGSSSGDVNKPHYGTFPTNTGFSLLTASTGNAALPSTSVLTSKTRVGTGITVGGTDYFPFTELNPLLTTAFGDVALTYGRVPPADGFFTPVHFVGAMAESNWAADWSLASRLGLLDPATTFGNYTGIVPTVGLDGSSNLDIGINSDMYAGVEAEWWMLLESPAGDWYYYTNTGAWVLGFKPTTVANLVDFSGFEVASASQLGALGSGAWTFYYGVDFDANGLLDLDSLYYDTFVYNVP